MRKSLRSNPKYKKLQEYLEKNAHKSSFEKLKKHLLEKKWPEKWIDSAYKELKKKPKKHALGDLEKRAHKSSKKYREKLFKIHGSKHFYEKPLEEKKEEEKKKLDEKESSKILKDAMDLAKTIVQSKKERAQSEVEKLFEFEEEDETPKLEESEEIRRERESLEAQKRSIELMKKKLEEEAKKIHETAKVSIQNDNVAEKLAQIENTLGNKEGFQDEFTEEEFIPEIEDIGDRAETGVPGLDPIIEGGFRRRSITLVAGGPGSGKTIFGMQYLVNGATKFNEPGIFITFERGKDELQRVFFQKGWDLEQLEKERKILILHLNPEQINKLLEAGGGTLRDAIEALKAKRIVIDSMSDFIMLHKGELAKRSATIDLFDLLNKMRVTTVIVAEQETDPLKHISSILEYQVDGVILLYNERIGHIRQRALEIFKMRGTKHAGKVFPMSISDQGLSIRTGL